MGDKTVVNPLVLKPFDATVSKSAGVTEINPLAAREVGTIIPGTILCGKYEVICPLNVQASEATLYVCRYRNKGFVAKVYRRTSAIKDDVILKIKSIDSQYVAKLHDIGMYDEHPFEILPYYKNGSLQGKTFNIEFLKSCIIPSINEGLRILHKNDIIHKDLKPSNIMLRDDGKSIAIIDFGISSVRESGNTVIVTRTGMTPEYSAPETFRNIFLAESDYFSFGITIYELYCGFTPYKGIDRDIIEQYVSVQRIPFPDKVPKDLENLVTAVTYYDITNRRDKNNPNRRWTYDDVNKWLQGESLPIPGESIGYSSSGSMQSYRFLRKDYSDIPSLVSALAVNWEDGKKQLFRGLLSAYFKNVNQEYAGYCIDAEEEVSRMRDNNTAAEDVIFWKLLLKIDTSNRAFYWRGSYFDNLRDLGNYIIIGMKSANWRAFMSYTLELLNNKLLSMYTEATDPDFKTKRLLLSRIENGVASKRFNEHDNHVAVWYLGYLLSEQRYFFVNGEAVSDVAGFSAQVMCLFDNDFELFLKLCDKLIDASGLLDAQFEAWLAVQGKHKEINQWHGLLTQSK